ncbi:hypothetical protein [Leucobacter sp. W1038]|uniref:hypothetical protein n=1 Tax=Leucobacter sp. W1038 TaxID=3438281 RepID=UPI003D995563
MHAPAIAAPPTHLSAPAHPRPVRDPRGMEASLTEWAGVHPLDDPDLVPSLREVRRLEVRRLNTRAGKRIAFVCHREDHLRTPSTAQLRYEVEEAAHLAARRDTPHARAMLADRRARLAARLAECARSRSARLGTAGDLPASLDAPRAEVAAAAQVTAAPPEHPPPAGTFRRCDHLHTVPTAERLTCALTMAPGAPSREVTAQS